jgi:tetratricopeptide (TPR) repeat protein
MTGRMFVVVVFLLFIGAAASQIADNRIIDRVQVRLAFSGGGCDASAHVALVGLSGLVAENSPNSQCEVDFFNVPEGSYHLDISGAGFADIDSRSIDMAPGGPNIFSVSVKRESEIDHNFAMPSVGLVSTSDLSVPLRARKELDRANELIGKRDFPHALEKLNKAIAIDPSYALAYNNLGVVYARMGDREREREALDKAIRLDDHFPLAYTNMGRLEIALGEFPGAEKVLAKASAFDPSDTVALALLSYAQLMDHHFDQAISTCHTAHALGRAHAFVHRVAASAYEQKEQAGNAIAELEMFLAEEPTGPRADAARRELEQVKAVVR